jgi:hypothetical protein
MAGKKLNVEKAVEREKFEPKLNGQQDSKTVIEKIKRIKVTFYLNLEDNLSLEEVKLCLKKQGFDRDKSELIREAIGLLSERYASKTV